MVDPLGPGLGAETIETTVTGLEKDVVYHFRVAASNEVSTVYGADLTFSIYDAGGLAESGPGSLRQAILDAPAGSMLLVTNTGVLELVHGELAITKDLSIIGPGVTSLIISGKGLSRVFNVAAGVSANISGLAICNGLASNGGTGLPGSAGGGVYNAGALTMTDCVISNCVSGSGGAGAYAGGAGWRWWRHIQCACRGINPVSLHNCKQQDGQRLHRWGRRYWRNRRGRRRGGDRVLAFTTPEA